MKFDSMHEDEFRNFLKKKGKKSSVIERNVSSVLKFVDFVQKRIEQVTKEDIDS